MGRVFFGGGKPAMEAPSGGIALSSLAVGSIVKLNESGSPVEFYVAKHDYESGLNGAGRTLLVRKGVHSSQKWGTNPTYGSSLIDTWFNGTYKAMLDAAVQSAIGTTKFYNIATNSTNTVSTQTRSVFALSVDELGESIFTKDAEGSALPIASTLANAGVTQWTRSPVRNASEAYAYYANGNCVGAGVTNAFGARPCFTLPATTLFDEETMTFKGVA